jgi:Multicopper oxidase
MQLVERLWAVVTTVVSLVTLSPLPESGFENHVSLQLPLSVEPIQKPHMGPIFTPPGTELGLDVPFQCNYTNMPGWEPCSTPEDRKCWLRRLSDGKRYDIFTNYEVDAPIGIRRYYELNLTDGYWDKDGLPFKAAKLFDKSYPGPWIQACWGDTVVVNVTNSLRYNGTSVHWHGIRQLNTTHMDGVNGVTQCPIARNDYFAYEWKAWQYGSSWYHSHYSVQYADGAVGPVTLHGPTSDNFDEAINPPLIMTDWGHESAFVAETNEGKLDQKDILLNGYGNVTRFNNIKNKTNIEPPYSITFEPFRPGKKIKKYLLRVINTSFDTTFVFSIDNHRLNVVSADFVPISPYKNTSILVGIGQRYNVIVEANPEVTNLTGSLDPNGNYWIRTWISPCFQMQPGMQGYERTGILRYNPGSNADPQSEEWRNISKACSDETYGDLHPMLPWTVKNPVNGDVQYGELFDVAADFSGVGNPYPLARFSLDLTGSYVPMRVDYKNPAFLNLNKTTPWDPQWRIIPENYTNDKWVSSSCHMKPTWLNIF